VGGGAISGVLMLSYKKFVWISLILVFLFAGLSIRGVQPNIWGDGLEYTLMTEALTEHWTPNITSDDYRRVQSYRGDVGTNVPAVAERNSLSVSPPFFRDVHGQYYSYHFWLYSLFVAPLFLFVKLLGIATPWAFVVTNLIFAIAASCAICMWRGIEREQRLLLLALFWSCGTIPYVRWTHPEVFSASILVISMIMALSRRYVAAAIVAALVAQQNPPVLFLVAMLLVVDFLLNYKETKSIVPSGRKMAGWIFCVALTSLSIGFFFVHFGTGSLIANSGGAKAELMSIERLWSFYFDLNQGLIVLLWPLLMLVPSMIACGLVGRRTGNVNYALVACLLLVSLMLAIPSLSTLNFNHGSSFISRYAYWAGIPLIFAVAYLYVGSAGSRIVFCAGVLIFSALNLWSYRGVWPNYLYYTSISERVMGQFPEAYNPVPEIFIERGVHIDGGVNPGSIYYYTEKGDVRKILLNGGYRRVDDFSCLGGGGVKNYINSISRVEQGWIYFNLKRGCAALYPGRRIYEVPPAVGRGENLVFDEKGKGKFYLDAGWSHQESWGTWSDGREASIILPLRDENIGEISFSANALVNAKHQNQMIDISVNGVNAGSVVLGAQSGNRFNVRVPGGILSGMGTPKILRLELKFRDPVRPKDLGINGDERLLAIGLVSLTIQ